MAAAWRRPSWMLLFAPLCSLSLQGALLPLLLRPWFLLSWLLRVLAMARLDLPLKRAFLKVLAIVLSIRLPPKSVLNVY